MPVGISEQESPPSASRLQDLGAKAFFRAREAAELGVSSRGLRRLIAAGSIERVARGLYRFAEAELTEHYTKAAVCARVPDAIVCLLSALTVHELGTQLLRGRSGSPFPIKLARPGCPSFRSG